MAMSAGGYERVQQFKRRQLPRPLIVLRQHADSERCSFFGYARNISRGGMFISSINPPQPGARFQLEFALPDKQEHTVRCQCEVVWNRPFSSSGSYQPGMGLKFLDIPEDVANAIDGWANASG